MSSLLSYHIFSFFISNIFENFKFGRNFSKFTAGMGCRLVAVSVKIGGNRRLPIGKENTACALHKSAEHEQLSARATGWTELMWRTAVYLSTQAHNYCVFY